MSSSFILLPQLSLFKHTIYSRLFTKKSTGKGTRRENHCYCKEKMLLNLNYSPSVLIFFIETPSLRNTPSNYHTQHLTDDILKCTSKLKSLIAFDISKIT